MRIKINDRERVKTLKVGLALSGGGLKGIAHIGVLKVLEERQIPVHMIAGTSAGSIIAALYACGYTPAQIEDLAKKIKTGELIDFKVAVSDLFKQGISWLFSGNFRFWATVSTGLVKGDKIERYLNSLLSYRTVRDTNIPLAITAVDLNSGDTVFFNTPVPGFRQILNARYYSSALLTDAVRASISIPGIFTPKKYRNMTLVDGAVKNNLPTDILHHMGANVIIAVDLGYAGEPNNEIHSVSEILLRSIEIMGREVTLLKGEQYADIIIRPPVNDLNFNSAKNMTACIIKGEQAARDKIGEIIKLIR